jgi:eukaryotic-like serine/threonine-protein kinase
MSFFKKLGKFFISRKFLLNFVGIILFWIVLIWGTMRYFDSYTNHGQEIAVPNMISMNIADVPAILNGTDLKYEVIDSVYNPNLLEGTVVAQNPMPTDSTGMAVKEGRVIKLRVSKQTRLVEVPYMVSKSRRFAESVLMAKGLRTRTTFVPSNEDQGSVISVKFKGKDLPKGAKLPINSVLELVVGQKTGSATVVVPDLMGLTINQAKSRLEGVGGLRIFPVYNDCYTTQDSLSAVIINQTPVAGDSSRIPVGSSITVFASPGR